MREASVHSRKSVHDSAVDLAKLDGLRKHMGKRSFNPNDKKVEIERQSGHRSS